MKLKLVNGKHSLSLGARDQARFTGSCRKAVATCSSSSSWQLMTFKYRITRTIDTGSCGMIEQIESQSVRNDRSSCPQLQTPDFLASKNCAFVSCAPDQQLTSWQPIKRPNQLDRCAMILLTFKFSHCSLIISYICLSQNMFRLISLCFKRSDALAKGLSPV